MNPISKTVVSGLAADYTHYDGLGLAELIATGQIGPLELLHAVRERADALNPKLNAFCQLFYDKAEAQIHAGLTAGPFSHLRQDELTRTWPYGHDRIGAVRSNA